ncbi:ribonuclease T [Lysobacter sp. CCNWLW3]|uniref:ribonuclease T n=1 Tax=unclassified Lysobacter TaxID=2635362 RepID=UPI002FD1F36B
MIDAGPAPQTTAAPPRLCNRFRGFLPVVVDVETGGFDWNRHALLEIAVVPVELDEQGLLIPGTTTSAHVVPAQGLEIDPKSLEVTGIDIDHPFRDAKPERVALENVFAPVREAIKRHGCQRAILVGHNAHFDLNFLNAAVARSGHKRNPFHPFSVFDTVTLGGLAYGQTVLARAVQAAGFEWNAEEAHSAVYDAERTAELFCKVVNAWPRG